MDNLFLYYVSNGNFAEAQQLFDEGIEFVLEKEYIQSLILEGKVESIKYLDNLGVTQSSDDEPLYAVHSNNEAMIFYYINKDKLGLFGKTYQQCLILALQNNRTEVYNYIKKILE